MVFWYQRIGTNMRDTSRDLIISRGIDDLKPLSYMDGKHWIMSELIRLGIEADVVTGSFTYVIVFRELDDKLLFKLSGKVQELGTLSDGTMAYGMVR